MIDFSIHIMYLNLHCRLPKILNEKLTRIVDILNTKFLSDKATEMFSDVVWRILVKSDIAEPSKLFWQPYR